MGIRTYIIQKLLHTNEKIFFYPKLRKFYKGKLREKQVHIIDVGANKGQSIDFFREICPTARIDAFEPNKKLFLQLKKKYYAFPNFVFYNVGLSNIKGELEFHENILDETSTFETLNMDSKYLEKKAKVLGVAVADIIVSSYKVNVIRLCDFLEANSDVFFEVVKIDVEGHELQCLEGLFNSGNPILPIRFIQLESHNDDMYANNNQQHSIEALLKENGFFQVVKIKHGFGDFYEIVYENQKI